MDNFITIGLVIFTIILFFSCFGLCVLAISPPSPPKISTSRMAPWPLFPGPVNTASATPIAAPTPVAGSFVSTKAPVIVPTVAMPIVTPPLLLQQQQQNATPSAPSMPPPVDCAVSDWSPYSDCSATMCGTTGSQTRTRTITAQPSFNGQGCPDLIEKIPCSFPCPAPVDCVASDWGAFSQCSATTCGTVGTMTRTKTVITPASNGGKMCPIMEDNQPCSTPCPTPVNCVVSDWTPFSECVTDTGACGTSGRQTRTRTIVTPMSGNGVPCPDLTEQQMCYKECPPVVLPPPPPPIDCVVSDWTPYTQCTSTQCGIAGKQMRTRTIVTQPANGGAQCPPLEDYATCNPPCPVAPTAPAGLPSVPVGLGTGKCVSDNASHILTTGGSSTTITDLGLCNSMAKAAGAPQFGLENSVVPGTGQCFYGTLPTRVAPGTNCTTYNGNLYGGELSLGVYNTV